MWNSFLVCPLRWQLEAAALWCLQQCLLLCPGRTVPPRPLSYSIQCRALLHCPTPRPRILAQPLAVHSFNSCPPVIRLSSAAQHELQTSHWTMCMFLWKPSDPVRDTEKIGSNCGFSSLLIIFFLLLSGKVLPVTAYDKDGVRMLLNFASDCPAGRPDVLVMVVSLLNTAPLPVHNVQLQAAVPKVEKLHLWWKTTFCFTK